MPPQMLFMGTPRPATPLQGSRRGAVQFHSQAGRQPQWLPCPECPWIPRGGPAGTHTHTCTHTPPSFPGDPQHGRRRGNTMTHTVTRHVIFDIPHNQSLSPCIPHPCPLLPCPAPWAICHDQRVMHACTRPNTHSRACLCALPPPPPACPLRALQELSTRLSSRPCYLYCHQGCCEHLLQVRDMRLQHPGDPQDPGRWGCSCV